MINTDVDRDALLELLDGITTPEEAADRLEALLPLTAEWRWGPGDVDGDTLTSTKQWRHVTDWR